MGLVISLLTACGDDASSSSSTGGGNTSGTASGGGDDTGTGLPSSGAGAVDEGDPHTPATGCDEGFVACGDVCASTDDDSRHCGGCDQDCSLLGCGEGALSCGCVAGSCVADQGCPYGPTCDGACLDPSAYNHVDHCGSCDNRCGDLALCISSRCVDTEGDGSSCERPAFWSEDEERAGFRMTTGNTVPHEFTCGPLEAIATRWFRGTVADDELRVEVEGGPSDDYVLQVFSDAACDDASEVACADGEAGEQVLIDVEGVPPGTTYWVAVGLKGDPAGAPATVKFDH